ncbi:hypothetical protein [Conexibacter sp. CPCC 206217]|uniref:hypothetical protein n=1 Tax=Conexibacter sp. CPCC 206217 TaxID=3064574 RepID=UPI002722D17F|nr:hypothetical protein [Conexibacter sp. CPCC 206217]MDO8213543.1 hypothetical protein [Conexibacter sp. CPCC 206217]
MSAAGGPGGRTGGETQTRTQVRAAAALRLTRVTRSGLRVTIAGRLFARASGRVEIAYRLGSGRSARTARARTAIRRGVFKTTLRLRGPLARMRETGRR